MLDVLVHYNRLKDGPSVTLTKCLSMHCVWNIRLTHFAEVALLS
jgi:hypothetical protein